MKSDPSLGGGTVFRFTLAAVPREKGERWRLNAPIHVARPYGNSCAAASFQRLPRGGKDHLYQLGTRDYSMGGSCQLRGVEGWRLDVDEDHRPRGRFQSVRRRSLCISLFAVGRGIEEVREALPTVLASVPPPAVLTRDFPVETERRPGVQMGSVQT